MKTHRLKDSPENENQVLFLGFFSLICGIIESVATVIGRKHLDKLSEGISFVSLQDLVALLHYDMLLILAQAEENGLLPPLPLLLVGLSLADLHVVEDGQHILIHCNSGGLRAHKHTQDKVTTLLNRGK